MAALAFSSLAPLWLGSRGVGWRVWGGVGVGGTYWQGPAMFSEAQFWQHHSV